MAKSVVDMLEKWSALMTSADSDEVEIEVSEWFQTLTEDVITRTAFGSSYEDGKAIFRLQAQQMVLASQAFEKVFIPGYRYYYDYYYCLFDPSTMSSFRIQECFTLTNVNFIEF